MSWRQNEINSDILRHCLCVLIFGAVSAWTPAALAQLADPAATPSPPAQTTLLIGLLQAQQGTTADFTQRIEDANGILVEQSSGRMALGEARLRWDVISPYVQRMLLDKNELQIYDPDLEQLTVRDLDSAGAQLPVNWLIDANSLADAQLSIDLVHRGEHSDFTIQPQTIDFLFAGLRLAFIGNVLEQMVILDRGGQRSIVDFQNVRRDQDLPPDRFVLDVPEGTDVVRG
jgi:outer membrane lipoprotein carrier protein